MNNAIIYDFETLSTNPSDGVVVSLAHLNFCSPVYDANAPVYEYEQLLEMCVYTKFNIQDQHNRGRRIQTSTLKWWESQIAKRPELELQLKPSSDDVSITEIGDIFSSTSDMNNVKAVFTRGNTFDPIFMESLCKAADIEVPYPFWAVRDTRSTIEGMAFGATEMDNKFIPEGLETKFVAHDPRHDIVMDVMRMQTIAKALT